MLSRESITKQILELSDKHNNFLLNIPMRAGKSIFATALCNKWEGRILILSGADLTNRQWLDNIRKYNPHLEERTDIYCYHSLHKIDRNKYSIILLDEFEQSLSDKRNIQLHEFNPKHWIAMSGTLDVFDINEYRKLTNNNFKEIKITLEEAVESNLLPQPKVICVPLQFDDSRRYLLFKKGSDKNKKNDIVLFPNRWESLKNKKVNTWIQCTEKEYHILVEQDYNYAKDLYEQHGTEVFKNMWLKRGNNRKAFYAQLKTKWVKKVINQLPEGSRSLIFCFDTKQADLINKEVIHSKVEGGKELIQEFNEGRINTIASVKMIDRGIDFFNVDYCIIIQQSGSQKSPQQQAGRSYLSISPKIITFYYPNTRDEDYLKEFLKPFKKEWITYKNI